MARPNRRPAHRSIRFPLLAAGALALAASAALPVVVFAQDGAPAELKEVENSKFATSGIITANAVYIRCGPGENYYPTMKLDKGARVKVVGAKFDWLKIVPPEGSFCYVARLYVDRHGDGKVGRVNKDAINVRAGSALSALKIGILCELSQNEEVEILGEEQEYFRIKPPAHAYLYIDKKFVEPDPDAKPEVQTPQPVAKAAPLPSEAPGAETPKPAAETPTAVKPAEQPRTEVAANTPNTSAAGQDFGTPEQPKNDPAKPDATKPETPKTDTSAAKPEVTPPVPNPIPSEPTQPTADVPKPAETNPQPAETPKTDSAAVVADPVKAPAPKVEAPAPKPAAPTFEIPQTTEAAENAFDKADAAYLAAKDQALDQQPLDTIIQQFEAVTKSDALPESLRRIAEARLITVKARKTAQAELFQVRQNQEDLKKKQLSLEAEQQELQKRITENTVKVYQAVGTLQPSSLQRGQGTIYRVTDPATGRTVCYMRTQDPATIKLIGQFVGIKGQFSEDARLGAKVLAPTEVTPCDPGRVHQTITAQIIPPSLMPREPAAQAATDPTPVEPQPQQ